MFTLTIRKCFVSFFARCCFLLKFPNFHFLDPKTIGLQQINSSLELLIGRTDVGSVLLYAAEPWRTNGRIESRLRGFEGHCLRRILRVRWQQHVSNEEVRRRTGICSIVEEVKRRRWGWLGHVLRMNRSRHPCAALNWTPPGKRRRGRPMK